MKIIYTAFLLFFANALISQTSEVGPLQGNPSLRSYAAKENLRKAKLVEQLTGVNPLDQGQLRIVGECPPELPIGVNLVVSGTSLTVELDTFGLGNDVNYPTLTIITPQPMTLGEAVLPDSSIELTFNSNPDFEGLGEETVQVEFSDASGTDIIEVVFTVVREGKTIIADAQVVDPEDVVTYCLDDEIDFDSPLACSEILTCIDNYPGEGDQLFHLTSYGVPDGCLVYYASRFPGVDTVCVMICDELGVCDEFKIPFEIPGQTLTVTAANPFFDDFSSYSGPYPTAELWLDRDVFVNNTLAKNPPSIGMATFDGLDRKGRPYDLVNGGVADQLTSKPIDLSGFTTSDVLSLRYFAAPKGYGQEPEETDSLKVEFLNNQGKWVLMDYILGEDFSINETPPFAMRGVPIALNQFLHDEFQFRFTARVSPGGYGDWWHVDYVYLGTVAADNPNFTDIALTEVPNTFLKNYTSMPWHQFHANVPSQVTDEYEAHFFNHYVNPLNVSPSSVNYVELTTGFDFNQNFTVDESGNAIPIAEPTTRSGVIPPNKYSDFLADLVSSIPDSSYRVIETTYTIFNSTQAGPDAYFSNDTASRQTIFSNYYAHDDGTAELQYFVSDVQGGEEVATQFASTVKDTIRAVQMMFPHYTIGDLESQIFTLKIWVGGDEPAESNLVFERELLKPFFPDAVYDTLQGFTTYKLEDILGEPMPVAVDAETNFFVGYEFTSNADLSFPVGLDRQHECDCNWANLNDGYGWNKFSPAFAGALLIRPVMESVPFNTSTSTTDVAPVDAPILIFPNPTSDVLNLKFENGEINDFTLLIFNQLGQLVAQPNPSTELDVSDLQAGIFYLQISDRRTGQHFVKKFVVSEK